MSSNEGHIQSIFKILTTTLPNVKPVCEARKIRLIGEAGVQRDQVGQMGRYSCGQIDDEVFLVADAVLCGDYGLLGPVLGHSGTYSSNDRYLRPHIQ